MFERTLGLSAPEFVGGDFNDAKAVRLFPHLSHGTLLRLATEFFQCRRSIVVEDDHFDPVLGLTDDCNHRGWTSRHRSLLRYHLISNSVGPVRASAVHARYSFLSRVRSHLAGHRRRTRTLPLSHQELSQSSVRVDHIVCRRGLAVLVTRTGGSVHIVSAVCPI